jgi:hypothetical protein
MSVVTLTKTPLQANLSYTQAGRDRFESGNPAGSVRGLVWADQAGTLYLEESDDGGGNWSQTATVSVSASTTTSLPWTVLTKQLYRFRYVNGATPQTKLRLIQHTRDMELTDTMLIGSSVPDAQAIPVQLSESIPSGTNEIGKVQLSGSNPEKGSAQDTQVAITAKTYNRAAGASRMEVYCESGYIRVRTDGQPCTSTTGEPIATGFAAAWNAETISVFYVQESIITVVSR